MDRWIEAAPASFLWQIFFSFSVHSKRGEAMGAFSMRAMVKQASERMLSEEETFRRWMQNLRWKNYKKGVS